MQRVPVKQIRPLTPFTAGNRMEVTNYKVIIDREGQERDSTSPIKQKSEATGGHSRCDKQPGYIMVGDKQSTIVGNQL